MNLLKKTGLLICFGFFLNGTIAQTVFCPPNVDFEYGNFSNWYLYTGFCCPINTNILSGPVTNRHTLTNISTPIDAYGGFPAVAPGGGNHSVKLGANITGQLAERARYYVRVPNNLNNYSLILRYAVVLQNPSHLPKDQPRFEVKVYDSLTNALDTCVNFTFVSSSALPGFKLSAVSPGDVYYKSWSTASLNLSGKAGKTIAVDFAAGDCALGAHFGYGYIDLNCGLFQISGMLCKGTTSSILTAPPGFQYYQWYDSSFTTVLGYTQSITVSTPSTFNKYKVILSPYPGYGCPDTLTTTIYVSDVKVKANGDTTICKIKSVQLNDSAEAGSKFLPLTYRWTPTTGVSCNTCLNPSVTPPTTTRYKLTVTDVNGCSVSDSFTVFVKLHIDSQLQDLTLCTGDKAVFRIKMSGTGPYNFQWKKNGVNITAPSADSLVINSINYSDTALYNVIVTGDCDSVISVPARLSIYPLPVITMQPQSVFICPGKQAVLRMKAADSSSMTYQWKKNGILIPGATRDSLVINNLSYSDSGYYVAMVKAQCEYVMSDTIFLHVQLKSTIVSQPLSISQCPGKELTLQVIASGSGTLTYQWMKDFFFLFGSNNNTYYIPKISAADTGNYYVVINSLCDSVISVKAKVSLNPLTKIILQPTDLLQCKGTTARFMVKASGTAPLNYQWIKNGAMIPNATKDTLTLFNIDQPDIASYSVVVMGGCDTVISNVVFLNLFPVNNVNLPDTVKLCTNNNIITLNGFSTYHWSTGSNNNWIPVTTQGKYWVRVTDNNSCVTSDTFYVKIIQAPIINAGNDTLLCNKLNLPLNATAADYTTFTWVDNSFGNFSDPFALSTIFIPNDNLVGKFPLVLSATNNCGTNYDTMWVTFTKPPDPDFIPEDTVVCQRAKNIVLNPVQPGGIFSGIHVQTNFFSPVDGGLFTVHYTVNYNGCVDSSAKVIRVVPLPKSNFQYTPKIPTIDSSVSFISTSMLATSLLWNFGDGNSSTETNPVNYYVAEGYYPVVLYTFREFCSDSMLQIIRVRGSEFVWVPNAFTPNGDGSNDVFKVIYKNTNGGTLKIFNKWGQRIFSTTDLNIGWDGTFEGTPSPVDVYVFVVEYLTNEGEMKLIKGNVTLIR
ncbi:MAG: gliding motility-associated C-terminal domain-containing protein [Bacteroidia bacterium]